MSKYPILRQMLKTGFLGAIKAILIGSLGPTLGGFVLMLGAWCMGQRSARSSGGAH